MTNTYAFNATWLLEHSADAKPDANTCCVHRHNPLQQLSSIDTVIKLHMLLQDYMHGLDACLSQLDAQPDILLEDRLHQLAFEALRLRIHRLRMTPEAHEVVTNGSEDLGSANELEKAFCKKLLVGLVHQ